MMGFLASPYDMGPPQISPEDPQRVIFRFNGRSLASALSK